MPSVQSTPVRPYEFRQEPADFGPKFDLPEIDVADLDYNLIRNGILHASAPLVAGSYWLPGKYKDAHVVVKPNTMAWMTVCLAKNAKNESVIASTSIKLNPPVTVTNPSTAYEPPGCMNGFKDLFADIVIEGIEIASDGRVLFQGVLKKGFQSEDIKNAFKPEMFPTIDLRLEALKKKKPDLTKVNLSDLIPKFGKLLGEIKCSARIHAETEILALATQGLKIKSNRQDAELRLHVKAKMSSAGTLKVKMDDSLQSMADFLHARAILDGQLDVSNLTERQPQITGQVFADGPFKATQLWIDYKDQSDIPCVLGEDSNHFHGIARFEPGRPVELLGAGEFDLHIAEVDELNVKGVSAEFQSAHVHIDGSAELHGKRPAVQGSLDAVLSHPRVEYKGIHGVVKGEAGVRIQAKDLMHGCVEYHLASDRLPKFKRQLGYEFFPNAQMALHPHNSGVSELLDPVTQFVWDAHNIADPQKPAIAALGSLPWQEFAQHVTQAPLRKRNRVTLLKDGVMSFPKRVELIRRAKRSVHVQSLIFKDDESGMAIAQELVGAYKRGVDVCVIVDSLGNLDSVKELIRGNRVYEYLRANNVKLELYSNMAVKGLRDILAVIEGHRVLQGLNSLKDFVDPQETLSTLHMLARVAHGTLELGLTPAEQQKIAEGLKMILGNDEHALTLIERLADIGPARPLQLSEMIEVLGLGMSLNHRWHEKYFVIDGEKAILGGMNIADEYLKGGLPTDVTVVGHRRTAWRDTDIFIEGEGAWDADKYFAKNWKFVSGQELELGAMPECDPSWDTQIQVIQSAPQRGISHPITNLKIEAIKSLQPGEKAYEASAYFLPVGALKPYAEVLKMAAQRGVDVRIVTNSLWTTDMPQVNKAAAVLVYRDLLKAGVRIFERTGERTMHQKTAVYGSVLGLAGSYNLDNRSASLNSEDLVVIHGSQVTQELEQMILRDMQEDVALEKTLADYQSSEPLEEIERSVWAMMGDLM